MKINTPSNIFKHNNLNVYKQFLYNKDKLFKDKTYELKSDVWNDKCVKIMKINRPLNAFKHNNLNLCRQFLYNEDKLFNDKT